MKIAYLGVKGLPSKGGTERVVEAIIRRLAARHTITVYCDDCYTPAGTRLEGVRLVRVPSIRGKHTQAASLFFLSALHALFRGDYDLIHLNGVEAACVLPLLRLRYRVVATSHGSPTRNRRDKWGRPAQWLMEQMEAPFLFLSNYPTSVSLPDADYFETRYGKKTVYIPNGVDEHLQTDRAAAADLLREQGITPGSYLLFCAGRIDPSKGCHLAIEAYCQVQPDIPLLIVGDARQVPEYTEHLKALSAGRPVVFLPLITDKELLYGLVEQCRLFIFPSIREGMSVMLLEAASLGVPILSSDIPENQASMGDYVLYFKSGEALDLAEKLGWALDHPGEMAALGAQAKDMVGKVLPWGKIADCYDTLYRSCAAGQAMPDLTPLWRT